MYLIICVFCLVFAHVYPRCLLRNHSGVVELEFESPVCLELFRDSKELGRFMLRHAGHTIAAGLVEEVRGCWDKLGAFSK